MRYDAVREIYRDCKWCQGAGCLFCNQEADKAYQRQFPDGPQLLATFDMTTESGRQAARNAIGVEAIQKAFGDDGGGVEEIAENCRGELGE